MTTLVDVKATGVTAAASPVVWSNVSGGATSLSPTSSPVLVATVPFGSGSTPLADGLWGLLWMSWKAKSATTGKFSIAENRFIGGVKGAASVGSYAYYGNANLDATVIFLPNPNNGFVFDSPDNLATYVQLSNSINGSGDLEVSLVCLSTDNHSNAGVAWVFSDLAAEYRIVGAD